MISLKVGCVTFWCPLVAKAQIATQHVNSHGSPGGTCCCIQANPMEKGLTDLEEKLKLN